MHFKTLTRVPPNYFQWIDPDSGTLFKRHAFDLLYGDVQAHRSDNGYAPVTREEVQNQNCQRLPDDARSEYCDGEGAGVDGVTLGLADIMRGTEAILRFKLAGSPLVEPDEAERRAAICAGCLYNAPYKSGCGGTCAELVALVDRLIGGAKTSHDARLKACAVCKCSIPAKIWIDKSILDAVDTAEVKAKYPSWCWNR